MKYTYQINRSLKLFQAIQDLWSLHQFSTHAVKTMQATVNTENRKLTGRLLKAQLFEYHRKADLAVAEFIFIINGNESEIANELQSRLFDSNEFPEEIQKQFKSLIGEGDKLSCYIKDLPGSLRETLDNSHINIEKSLEDFQLTGKVPRAEGRCESGGLLGEKGGCALLGGLTIGGALTGNPLAAGAGLIAIAVCCTGD